jgi:hypothetical protein
MVMSAFVRRVLTVLLVSGSCRLAFSATGLDGRAIDPLAATGTSAVVLFFAATDCPISNRYIPEIQRMQTEFAKEGVRFWFVYPNPADITSVVRSHDAQFAIEGSDSNTALDPRQMLVRRAGVVATPEVAVFVPMGKGMREVYHGRIDDRYIAFGRERPKAMHHDLELAVRAALAHKPVLPPGGGPGVCAIMPLQP